MAYTTIGELKNLLDEDGLLVHAVATGRASEETPVDGCSFDSRSVAPGDVFFCKGNAFRPAFLEAALAAGAVAFVAETAIEADLAPIAASRSVHALYVEDVRLAMAAVPPLVYGHPDEDLAVVGITGTKGKSSTAYMLRAILDEAGRERNAAIDAPLAPRTGIIGSIDTFDGIVDEESHNTTPEAPALWRHLANARDSRLSSMVMEVSSQALKYDRTLGLTFDIACFLNIGLDHISDREHDGFEDYFSSKLRIFDQCLTAVVNLDADPTHLPRILEAARRDAPATVTFGIDRPEADVEATDLATVEGEIWFTVRARSFTRRMHLPFPGDFNVSNALAAIATAELMGIDADAIDRGLATVVVPGRMEFYRSRDRKLTAVVDYAHNRLSFEALFPVIRRDYEDARVIALFGAAGCKALERRVELPQIAARYADLIVFTAEDPWNEDPADICREMAGNLPEGFPYEIVVDREEAVARCFELLDPEKPTVILLLAKGRETDQHVADGYAPLVSDTELAIRYVREYDESHPA